MTNGLWILSGIAAVVVAAACLEAYVKRNNRRSLSRSQPDSQGGNGIKVELGQEATDLELVERTSKKNQVQEEKSWRWSRRNK